MVHRHICTRSIDDFGFDDEIRTMFINVRQKTEKARSSMAQRYNSSSSVRTFSIGDLVSLHIDAKYRKSTAPAKLFCKVIRKPLPDMHELQCVHGVCLFVCLSSCISIPLHGARRAMAAALPLPLADSGGFYTFYTHFLTPTSLRGHSEVFLISTLRPLKK